MLEHLFASSGVLSEKWLNEGIITSLMDYSIISNIDLDCLIFYNISDAVERGNKRNIVYFVYDLYSSFNDFFEEVEEVSKITLEDIEKAYYNICKARTTLAVLRGD